MKSILKRYKAYRQRKRQKKATPYEYIEWLRYANAGMLVEGNLYCLEYAIKNLPSNKPVIEIGSFCGLSTNVIAFYLEKFSKKNLIVTCDKWMFENVENIDANLDGTDIKHRAYKTFVKETYMRNVSFFAKNNLPYTIEVLSDEFFEMWANHARVKDVFGRDIQLGGQVSFAYIDGNHSYEFVKKDFINTDKNLEIGGFILFDDSSDFSAWEVKRVVKEVIQTGRYTIIIKNPNYLFKKIK